MKEKVDLADLKSRAVSLKVKVHEETEIYIILQRVVIQFLNKIRSKKFDTITICSILCMIPLRKG